MERTIWFLLLCVCHVAGDYFIQSERLSEKKTYSFIAVLQHLLLYGIPYFFCYVIVRFIYGASGVFVLLLECVLLHAVVDIVKYFLVQVDLSGKCFRQVSKEKINQMIYIIDQVIHITCLVIVIVAFQGQLPQISGYAATAIPYVLYFMCMLKPANVTFKALFSHFQVKVNDESTMTGEGHPKEGAGAWIGNMERLLSGIFILLGQFSAVGLTMTAKSIVRYDQIAKKPAFAEYYLIGTLYSILYTIVLYCLIFKFIL